MSLVRKPEQWSREEWTTVVLGDKEKFKGPGKCFVIDTGMRNGEN